MGFHQINETNKKHLPSQSYLSPVKNTSLIVLVTIRSYKICIGSIMLHPPIIETPHNRLCESAIETPAIKYQVSSMMPPRGNLRGGRRSSATPTYTQNFTALSLRNILVVIRRSITTLSHSPKFIQIIISNLRRLRNPI